MKCDASKPPQTIAAASSVLRKRGAERCACIIGGGFCGLACAAKLPAAGFGICIADPAEPGGAAASGAAAGLLDPLSPKGKIMWRGMEAFEATLQLLRSLSDSQGTNVSVRTGCLHVARGSKQAAAMREAVSSMPPADALRLGREWYEPAACEAFGHELAETGASNGRSIALEHAALTARSSVAAASSSTHRRTCCNCGHISTLAHRRSGCGVA